MVHSKGWTFVIAALALVACGASAQKIVPNPLLAIDQNRSTVVERIVGEWGDSLAASNAGITSLQLREILTGLRSDHLLAASLAGSVEGLRDVVSGALVHGDSVVSPGLIQAKSLGDTTDDLVYTPVTPCRILDTRYGTVPPYNAVMVGGAAFPVAANLGSFTTQGGSATNCNLPASFQAIAVTFTVLNPNFDAFLAASNTSDFATLTQSVVMDFSANRGLANTAIVPVDGTVKFYLGLPASVTTNVIADAVGYLKPPGAPLPVTTVTAGTGLAGGGTSGTVDVSIAAGGVGNAQLANSAVDVSKLNTTSTDARYFKQGGNAFGVNPTVLGTTDSNALHVSVGGAAALQILADATSPLIDAGYSGNSVTAGASGGVIGGGGATGSAVTLGGTLYSCPAPGCANRVTDAFGSIGGGLGNQAGDAAGTATDRPFTTVSGGWNNTASGNQSTVGGGQGNIASGESSTVGGGYKNTASGNTLGYSTVAGGYLNIASGDYSTVAGGQTNNAISLGATVGGGFANTAGGIGTKDYSTVGGGAANTASGLGSTVAGGYANAARGLYSFAAGYFANADQDGCFVFANWSSVPGSAASCLGNKYIAHFFVDHGFAVDYGSAQMNGSGTKWLAIGDTSAGNTILASNGAKLTDAGVWVNASSSKASKTDFAPVDVRQVLAKVARLPITTWRYKQGEGEVRHMGPMAEDFDAAFGIGYGPQTIADLDARGVALAAIQGLHQMMQQKDREIAQLKRKLEAIEAKLGLN